MNEDQLNEILADLQRAMTAAEVVKTEALGINPQQRMYASAAIAALRNLIEDLLDL